IQPLPVASESRTHPRGSRHRAASLGADDAAGRTTYMNARRAAQCQSPDTSTYESATLQEVACARGAASAERRAEPEAHYQELWAAFKCRAGKVVEAFFCENVAGACVQAVDCKQ